MSQSATNAVDASAAVVAVRVDGKPRFYIQVFPGQSVQAIVDYVKTVASFVPKLLIRKDPEALRMACTALLRVSYTPPGSPCRMEWVDA